MILLQQFITITDKGEMMKKILTVITVLIMTLSIQQNASALCIQCPEIQKLIKKEITFSKEQKKEIKQITKDMKSQIKDYEKEYKKNQRKIDKILKADCPDIVAMVEYKNRNAVIKRDVLIVKKESLGKIFEVYTEDQQYTAKRILSENTGMITKKPCDFCGENPVLRTKCAKCNKK